MPRVALTLLVWAVLGCVKQPPSVSRESPPAMTATAAESLNPAPSTESPPAAVDTAAPVVGAAEGAPEQASAPQPSASAAPTSQRACPPPSPFVGPSLKTTVELIEADGPRTFKDGLWLGVGHPMAVIKKEGGSWVLRPLEQVPVKGEPCAWNFVPGAALLSRATKAEFVAELTARPWPYSLEPSGPNSFSR